jgi:signal transduction histidine kinase
MNPVVVSWSLAAGAALTLGFVHALAWLHDRTARANAAFAVVAASFACMAAIELELMYAATPAEYDAWVRFFQVPIFGAETGLVLFLHFYLGTATKWLGWIIVSVRGLILAATLLLGMNVNFDEIASLDRVPFLGESVATVGDATVGRWQWLATTNCVLLVLYALDATVRYWRSDRPDVWRRGYFVGGAFVLVLFLSTAPVQLVIWGAVQAPLLVSPPVLILVLAMGAELSREVLRSARLARDLHDRDEQLELSASAADLGLWVWNGATGAIRATDKTRAVLGIEKSRAIDIDAWCAAIHPDDVAGVRRAFDHAVARCENFNAEFRCSSGKDVRWIVAQGRTDKDAKNGASIVMRGVVRDISEAKRARDEAGELRRDLAHSGRVTMLGQLSAALAHELNQPLGAILRNAEAAEMLLARPNPDLAEVREILTDIRKDDRRAGNVIDHLRALLRRGSMEKQPLQIEAVVRDVIALVRGDAAGKRVALDFVAASPLPPALGDRVHLSQVLLNLIMNGIDAVHEAKEAAPRVAIDARCRGGMIEVAVADSGGGIAADAVDKVFEPFFTTKPHGMGMGLPVSRTIVEAHGGKLWAESNGGPGATFRFTVPAAG